MRDVETMRRSGLALGGSLENAVVIGETGVLNKLRFEDEFVRHKILDAIGDLALLGCPLVGRLEAHKAGHALHAAVARKLLATEDAWALVSSPEIPALARSPAGAGPRAQALPGLRSGSGRPRYFSAPPAAATIASTLTSRRFVAASFDRMRIFRSTLPL